VFFVLLPFARCARQPLRERCVDAFKAGRPLAAHWTRRKSPGRGLAAVAGTRNCGPGKCSLLLLWQGPTLEVRPCVAPGANQGFIQELAFLHESRLRGDAAMTRPSGTAYHGAKALRFCKGRG
jgi:hypothetical protein